MLTRSSWCAAAVALTLPSFAGAAAATPGTLSWQPCGQGECSSVEVPVDWSHPDGAKMDIAIGRLPATDPQHRIGVLFVPPGGPGASGIDTYVLGGDKIARLRRNFDIVSWDQRGVKRSGEVRCSEDLLDRAPKDFPATEQQYRALLDYNARLGADCRAHTGPVFDFVDTTSAVRDLDAIRGALGEDELSFYGASYGTQVEQQYAELFPHRVRAMVADSNMDHGMTSGGRYIETTSADLEGSFSEFADWCERTANCPLHGRDVRAVWDGLHARAEAGRLTDPATGRPLTAEALRSEALEAMYRPEERWYPFAERLKALQAGTPAASAQAAPALAQNSYQAIWCEDWNWQVRDFAELRSWRDRAAEVAPHTRLSPFFSDVTACLGWPAEVRNPQHRLSISGTPPILVVTGKYDVATPNAWNRAVAEQIPHSVLLEHDGIGHGQYYRNDCVTGRVEDYLTTLRTPPPNTHCPAAWPAEPPPAAKSAPPPRRPAHTA
ncbi:alpha/beta hydrolase [Saccharopolyspora rosea]|uniref:Alpha/beta hydrolase n=1 Tax=Saccharopolyspora rosea TaxID=524884 RepID=A0ABW3FLA3_9PSEU